MTPRHAAVSVLLAVERGRTTLAAEFERAHHGVRSPRDRALVVELCTGALRWQARLDALLAQCSKRPMARLSSGVRAILRMSAYQLEYLDRAGPCGAQRGRQPHARVSRPAPQGSSTASCVRAHACAISTARPARCARGDRGAADVSGHYALPSTLARRAMADQCGFEATERWCQFNKRRAGRHGSGDREAVAMHCSPAAARRHRATPARGGRRHQPAARRLGRRVTSHAAACAGRGLAGRRARRRAPRPGARAGSVRRTRRQDDGL